MFLSEVHEQLAAAELSKIFDADGGVIKPEALPKINAMIQAGITDINKRFAVREKDILVSTNNERKVYELVPANAVSSGNPNAFIKDSVEDPYLGDISQILRITDGLGQSLWLNTDVAIMRPVENVFGKSPAMFTNIGINLNAYNTLRLSEDTDIGDIIVYYKARLKPMDLSKPAEEVFIDLPDHFLNALVYYTAHRRFNPNGAETIGRGMFHAGNNYFSKYMEEITDLRNNLGSIGSMGETTNFQRGGWA